MTSPAVTVLMSVCNGEAYLRDAIDSILTQSYEDFELLVVDDGSVDGTGSILASYADRRIRLLRNAENLGLTRSLNIGLREARGALIARLDADDISYPHRLTRQVRFLEAHPDVAALGTQFVSLDARGRRRPLHLWMRCQTALGIRWQLMFENAFVHSSMMFRRDTVLKQFSGYDESFRTNQDFELWSRLACEHPLRNLGEALVGVRGRPSSVSTRYSLESVGKVGDILVANCAAFIGAGDIAAAGADALVRLTSPVVHPPPYNIRHLIQWIDESYRIFTERFPGAEETSEIRAQAASLIARTASLCASYAPLAMSRWYLESARYHLPTFVRGAARFALTSARAAFSRSPVQSAASKPETSKQEQP